MDRRLKRPRDSHMHFMAWSDLTETAVMVACTKEIVPECDDPERVFPWLTYKAEFTTCPHCKEVATVEDIRSFLQRRADGRTTSRMPLT